MNTFMSEIWPKKWWKQQEIHQLTKPKNHKQPKKEWPKRTKLTSENQKPKDWKGSKDEITLVGVELLDQRKRNRIWVKKKNNGKRRETGKKDVWGEEWEKPHIPLPISGKQR